MSESLILNSRSTIRIITLGSRRRSFNGALPTFPCPFFSAAINQKAPGLAALHPEHSRRYYSASGAIKKGSID
jgi:hypothetical protein